MTSESLSIRLTLRQLRHPGDLFIFLCRVMKTLTQPDAGRNHTAYLSPFLRGRKFPLHRR